MTDPQPLTQQNSPGSIPSRPRGLWAGLAALWHVYGWMPAEPLERAGQALLAVAAWTVLGLALWLTPAEGGLGTHTQLGMAPCGTYLRTGVPCPSCGMTTAFALMAHGRPVRAAVVQPAGAVLFLATLALALGLSVTVVRGRSVQPLLVRLNMAWLVMMFFALILAGWIYKIAAVRLHWS